MSAVFEFHMASEPPTANEVRAITGCPRRADQVAWLAREGRAHVRSRGSLNSTEQPSPPAPANARG